MAYTYGRILKREDDMCDERKESMVTNRKKEKSLVKSQGFG